MTHERIGRNDPCPCGSGKKYKHCCLAADEQRAAMRRSQAPAADSPDPLPMARLDPKRVSKLLREHVGATAGKERVEIDALLAETGPLLAFMEREPEIRAAFQALEARRTEFESLLADDQAYSQRSQALFAEEPFVPLRFTAEDVRRAFEQVGQPPDMAADEEFVDVLRAAILHLADKERRRQLSMSLLLRLPDYVEAGRPLEADIIRHCAFLTVDALDDTNPFLFQMFAFGYDAWAAEQRVRDAAVLTEIGLDLPQLEGMNLDDIDGWLARQEADPAQRAKLEAVLEAHPDQQALAIANYEEMQRHSGQILEREDAAGLLLSREEIEPWLPRFFEAVETVRPHLPDPGDPAPDPAVGKTLVNALHPVLSDMAAGIFTEERLRQLAAQLKAYRNDLFAAHDKRAAGYTQAALSYVEHEDEPDKNTFLKLLCLASVRALES